MSSAHLVLHKQWASSMVDRRYCTCAEVWYISPSQSFVLPSMLVLGQAFMQDHTQLNMHGEELEREKVYLNYIWLTIVCC